MLREQYKDFDAECRKGFQLLQLDSLTKENGEHQSSLISTDKVLTLNSGLPDSLG